MPKKNPVVLKYRRVKRKRRSRAEEWAAQIVVPVGLSPLARYVESGMDTGIPVAELIWQFQEFDCEHEWTELGIAKAHVFFLCDGCGKITKKARNA